MAISIKIKINFIGFVETGEIYINRTDKKIRNFKVNNINLI